MPKSSENFGKLRKRFKSVFQMFLGFLKFSEIFGKLWKRLKVSVFSLFYDFLKFFGKPSVVFENHRKTSRRDRNCS